MPLSHPRNMWIRLTRLALLRVLVQVLLRPPLRSRGDGETTCTLQNRTHAFVRPTMTRCGHWPTRSSTRGGLPQLLARASRGEPHPRPAPRSRGKGVLRERSVAIDPGDAPREAYARAVAQMQARWLRALHSPGD